MAEFEIKIDQIKSSAECEKEIAEKIASAGRELAECQSALDTSVSRQYVAVKRNLNSLNSRLSVEAGHMQNMAQALGAIYATYYRCESEITGQKIENAKAQTAKNYAGSSADGTNVETKDILSFISKLIKNLNTGSDNAQAKTLASFLSAYANGLKLSDSENIAEWYTAFVGFAGSTIGLGGKFGESFKVLAEKYGTDSLKEWFAKNGKTVSAEMDVLGTFGNVFGFSSSYLQTIQDSDSFAEFLKNSDGWLTSGKDLVVDLSGLGKEFNKTTAGPAVTLLSMGSYLAGDIIDLSTDGHSMTGQELSDLFLGTALTGVNTGVSQLTFGLVDIDVDRSMGIFDKNVAWTTDKIASTGIPLGGQVALGLVATPFVAAYSLGETVLDTCYQLEEKIEKGVQTIVGDLFGGKNNYAPAGGGAGGGGMR